MTVWEGVEGCTQWGPCNAGLPMLYITMNARAATQQ